jgi:hypothetical protein
VGTNIDLDVGRGGKVSVHIMTTEWACGTAVSRGCHPSSVKVHAMDLDQATDGLMNDYQVKDL